MRPSDKQTHSSNKPLTPSMSAAFNRTAKAPLTPKLAGYNSPQINRKIRLPDGPTSEKASPASSACLNANITPRSTSRSSRKDAVSSPLPGLTPYTQQPSRSTPQSTGNGPTASNINTRESNSPSFHFTRPKSVGNTQPQTPPLSNTLASYNSPVGNSSFFHASDAVSSTPSHDAEGRQSCGSTQSGSTHRFVYADGKFEGPANSNDHSRRPVPLTNKVLNYGNEPSPNTRSLLVSPKLQNAQPHLPSPREFIYPPRDPRRLNLGPPHDNTLIQHLRPSPSVCSTSDFRSHIKSPSIDGSQCFRPNKPHLMSPPSHPVISAGDRSDTTSPSQSPMPTSNRTSASGDILHPFPRAGSPSKADPIPNPRKLNDAASNARSERKVLDLEISNSSLLAINRALEKEMRKQTAELRRYRRLSRAGKLSITPSRRSVSGGALSILSETDDATSIQSSHSQNEIYSDSEDEYTLSELEEGDDEGANTTDSMSSAEVGPLRPRDEKFLLDDLAKHQQLLIDGQKLNQSIRRCLGWTESLITQGKKALEYQVHVSDIAIGGRVLSQDDQDELWEGGKGLLSPTHPQYIKDQSTINEAISADLPLSDAEDSDNIKTTGL